MDGPWHIQKTIQCVMNAYRWVYLNAGFHQFAKQASCSTGEANAAEANQPSWTGSGHLESPSQSAFGKGK